jgi:tetratricopeptide (TPR) repeat protein
MSNLNTNLPLNKTEEAKAKMENLHNFILKGWEIQDISVDGWASPEGEIDFNDNLANDRAETTQKYMEKHMAKMNKKRAKELGVNVSELEQDVKYNIKGNGEDWDGFLMAVKNSDLKDKSMILNVINSQPDVNKREEEMRNMTVIYKEIEDNILPPLRRADLTVNCFEPKRSDEEIAKLATSSPDSLSYKEILHAATLTEDHEARLNIYKAAFTNKDRDWKAYNNAAVEAVALKKYDDAANFLAQAEKLASKNGKIENNLGVLACHNEDYEVAEQHFMKAMSYGENENYNLGVISIQKGEYAKALNYFKGIDCKHNVALAQLLSDNMDAALKNFKCAPESGKTYYMLAVYGARTNNAEMVYENLGKSIQKCGEKLKEKVKTDREFIKYFDEPNFKSLVE